MHSNFQSSPVYFYNPQEDSYQNTNFGDDSSKITQFGVSVSVDKHGLLSPQIEFLRLVESFIKFKGEVASKFYALLWDNSNLLRALFRTFIRKVRGFHRFTLFMVQVLRKVLQFASSLMVSWTINKPSFEFGFHF